MFAAMLVVNAATFGFHFIASRIVGVNSYGELYTMMSIVSLSAVLGGVGTSIVARLAADAAGRARWSELAGLSGRVLVFGIGAGAILGIALTLAAPLGASYFHTGTEIIVVTAWSVATQITLLAGRGLLQGGQRFGLLAISLVGEAVARTIVGVGLTLHGWGATGALIGYLAGALAAIAFTYFASWRIWGVSWLPASFPNREIRRVVTGAGGAMLALSLLTYADVLLAKHYVEPRIAGLYSAVALIGKIVLFASSFVPMLLLPKAAELTVQGKSPLPVLLRGSLATIVISGAVLCLLWLVPVFPQLMMGAQFSGISSYVLEYGIAMAFLGLSTALVSYRIGVGSYGFIPVSFGAVAVEAIGISWFHASLAQIIYVVICANAVNLAGTALGAIPRHPRPLELEDALNASVTLERATEPL